MESSAVVEIVQKWVRLNPCRDCCSFFPTERPSQMRCAACVLARVTARREKEARYQAQIEARLAFHGPRACRECGTAFTPASPNSSYAFCSRRCMKQENRRVSGAQRKARKHGLYYESFDPLLVLERDGWKCQLCGCPTPKRLRGTTDPKAPELDHIVPLAAGGTHTWDNTQCACRQCNRTKFDKPLGQLRLPQHLADRTSL